MNKSEAAKQDCIFPPVFAIKLNTELGPIQQLAIPSQSRKVFRKKSQQAINDGFVINPIELDTSQVFVRTKNSSVPVEFKKIIEIFDDNVDHCQGMIDLTGGQWIRHPSMASEKNNYEEIVKQATSSWHGAFSYNAQENTEYLKGLREPQIGAIHSIHAHWTVSRQPATIVMPTGTGKTEVMLSILVSQQLTKLLVVVPTDALRTQIANRFLSLGILKEIGVVSEKAMYPIIGMLNHIPKNIVEVDNFFKKCNVIVTTMQTAGQCDIKIQKRMANYCPYLFIDEAHHAPAKTWVDLKESFKDKTILQFTATPFRNDDKPVEGKIIFNYPLLKAQEEGYFKAIQFKPIKEFNPLVADQRIAEKAVEQLYLDRKKGFNHVLMARVDSIKRAGEVFSIYSKYKEFNREYKNQEFNPVLIHNGIQSESKRLEIRKKILSGHSKIVVCVDMLGEGFDLPELKIAAFHDVKKSLPVTLQLAGRFTRVRSDLGTPTFIANIGDITVQNELRKLYAQDADWNVLLPQNSQTVIQKQVELWEFLEGFKKFPKEIPLQNVKPLLYTVVYRTHCATWTPERFEEGLDNKEPYEHKYHDINHKEKTLIIAIAKKNAVDWADIEEMFNLEWELFVIFWDIEQNLLFINTSGWRGHCKHLAEAVAGKDVKLIMGNEIFRCLAGLNRLKLHNVGLRELPGGYITYTMRAGPDVAPALSTAQIKKSIKSNFAGIGYDDDKNLDYAKRRTYLGCSYRGRIWSNHPENLSELKKQFSGIGRKLIDKRIRPNKVLMDTLIPKIIRRFPKKNIFSIQWPEIFYSEPQYAHQFIVDDRHVLSLSNTDIRLKPASDNDEICFEIYSDFGNINFNVVFKLHENGKNEPYSFSLPDQHKVIVKQRTKECELDNFFYENPPIIWFCDGSYLEGNQYIELPQKYDPYRKSKIMDKWIDWDKTNIKAESQGVEKNPESIQFNVIKKLIGDKGYCLIFDDDDSGEAADIVCARDSKKMIEVEFYHCKYSKKEKAGSRVGDLYEVCGQAQKSVQWVVKPEELFAHLEDREHKRMEKLKQENPNIDEAKLKGSRFEVGNMDVLTSLKNKSMDVRTLFKIFIVQPGLKKSKPSRGQLELLSVTENYLLEMYNIPFRVIASK